MLNIISRSIYQKHPSGPKKLIDNLLKGFNQLGIPYVLNKNPLDCQHTWIHDDPDAITYICKNTIPDGHKFLFGPNIFFQPEQINSILDQIKGQNGIDESTTIGNSNLLKGKYIMPSTWVADYWKKHGYTAPSMIWPIGIDTEYFSPEIHKKAGLENGKSEQQSQSDDSNRILLYTKGRDIKDIQMVINILNSNNAEFIHIEYGKHSEPELMTAGANCKFGIIVDSSESQGIAIQELMSLNLPLIIFDIDYLNQKSHEDSRYFDGNTISRDPATSVPYFDNRCGKIVKSPDDLKSAISEMLAVNDLSSTYSPRRYIEENLSLQKQALEFLKNIDYPIGDQSNNSKININVETSARNWKNRTWYKPFLLAKFFIKYLKFKAKV